MGREIDAHRSKLSRGIDKPFGRLCKVRPRLKTGHDRALDLAVDVERRNVFKLVIGAPTGKNRLRRINAVYPLAAAENQASGQTPFTVKKIIFQIALFVISRS